MTTTSIELAGKTYELAKTFRVGERMAQTVGDPLVISRQYMVMAMMEERGMSYTPKFEMTLERTAKIIFCAANEQDKSIKLEEIQDAVVSHGALDAAAIALNFIAEFVGIGAEEKLPAGKAEKSSGE